MKLFIFTFEFEVGVGFCFEEVEGGGLEGFGGFGTGWLTDGCFAGGGWFGNAVWVGFARSAGSPSIGRRIEHVV